MKILPSPKSSEQGTALLVTLCLCMILSVTIAGYLKHAHQQHCLSMRSQSWNTSIAVTEAGIEEGLQHLNSNPNALASQGWVQSGSTYTLSRTLSPTTSYAVMINGANMSAPEITSQAFITDKSLAYGTAPVSGPVFAVVNGSTVTPKANSQIVSRAVRVKAGRDGLFLKAMVAKHMIDMNGNNIRTDSFNSNSSSTNNINGMYPAGMPSRLLSNGDVASNGTLIEVGNANIYGYVAVGPGGTVNVGSQGGIGTYSWQALNKGIQSGYFTDDMNFTFPNVILPYSSGLTPSAGSVSTTNYVIGGITNTVTRDTMPSPVPVTGVTTNATYTTAATRPSPVPYGTTTNILTTEIRNAATFPAAGTYVGTVKISGSKYTYDKITGTNYTVPTYTFTYKRWDWLTNSTITTVAYDYIIQGGAANMAPVDYYVSSISSGNILVKGNARLVVGGNFSLGGNGSKNQLIIGTDGKLEMWVGGTSCSLSGNGVVNQNGYAQNLIVWCDESVTSLTLNGNGQFTGILVAPNAHVTMNGGGNSQNDFIGALIVSSVKMNGHFSFHYDEALKNRDGGGRYKITAWNEVPASSTGLTYVGQ